MAPARLRIRLLGELDLHLGEEPVPPLGSARAESLLAYLLLHRDAPQPRQRLAFLLWPDSSEPQARTNLRHLLHVLRHALPDPDRFLEVTPRTLRWRSDAPWWLEVAAFEAAVARAERPRPARRPPPWARRPSCTAATSSTGPTTTGCWRSGTGSASATSRSWSGWSSCWRRGATTPPRSGMPIGSCATTPCARGLPGPDGAPRCPRGPGPGAARLPRLRGHARARAGGEVGFDISFAAAWLPSDPEPERHVAWARAGWERLRPHSAGVYVNFLSDEGEAGIETAYGHRLKRLTALKDRYDPTNLFRLHANIPPSAGAADRRGSGGASVRDGSRVVRRCRTCRPSTDGAPVRRRRERP